MSEVTLPIAHVGHWGLYLLPALVLFTAAVVAAIRERRAAAQGEPGPNEER